MKKIGFWDYGACFVLAFLVWFYIREEKVVITSADNFIVERLGRFQFMRPHDAVIKYHSAHMGPAQLARFDWPTSPPATVEQVMRDRLKKKKFSFSRGLSGDAVWDIESIDPSMRAVLYHDNMYNERLTYGYGVIRRGKSGVEIRAHQLSTVKKAEDVMNDTFRGLVVADGDRGNSGGFWLFDQEFHAMDDESEEIRVAYEGGEVFRELSFSFEVFKKNSSQEVSSLIGTMQLSLIRASFLFGLSVSLEAARRRTVAGLDGEELIVAVDEEGGHPPRHYDFKWRYEGKIGGFGNRPALLEVDMSCSRENYAEKLIFWRKILLSLSLVDIEGPG